MPLALSAAMLTATLLAAQAPAAEPGRAAPTELGDVNLTPKRLILSGRTRSGEVVVFNRGAGRAVYRVELKDLAMTPAGALVDPAAVTPEQKARLHSADGLIRFSPRRIELAPGESQVVRVLARTPEGTPAAEYRAHLSVSAVPPEGAGLDIAQAAGQRPQELRIRLVPVFGISIPIILRPVDGAAGASWSDAALVRDASGGLRLKAVLHRTGERSIYGDVELRYTPAGGRPVSLLSQRGVGVYPEVDGRSIDLAVAAPAGLALGAGDYLLTFKDDETPAGKVIAQTQVRPPG